ncbi:MULTISPECIES: ImmA/IrrE family metallo-endopeptidase [Nocardia]|uniref:ImmA/IrrE family metallo-endopeptidase n=2 Tax=Nocardia TaxID=1817 RepID=A0A2T2ZEK5_9NOCA|nr:MULTISPECIES: ImmA/IrrE family metallo-endopeptidase [Nocardia]MBF6242584.1 ImmA/IrrE family metallo-endopeptidase [Nocardia elegans]MBF6449659.1 ImmA/IrrE family metallo-endopeptidase [Nocardia elegans]PSR66156.1 ImmA/IrrE family metallo-endopeptidase [Nocardia nova]
MIESRTIQTGRSYRRVAVAVDAVCAVAADFDATTLEEVVLAISAERGRPIEITNAQLGPGVCGQRRSYPDRDVIVLAAALPSRDHTLAHELGHVVFDHPGEPTAEVMLEAGDDLIAYMLSQRAHQQIVDDGRNQQYEWEAETFAGMLTTRLRVFDNRGSGVSVLRFDEALG